MAEHRSILLSNKVIGTIAIVLAMGILLDGKLYNRTPKATGIFPLTQPATISISQHDDVIMAFEKRDDLWVMTSPTDAPLNQQRVQVLLDSNSQVSRSYSAAGLPMADLFPKPITMEIDGHQFQLGELEPVSKQRYVLAEDHVYLQADHVIPMLRAGTSAFLDLQLTNTVTKVEIDEHEIHNPEAWSSLKALGIVPRSKLNTDPITTVTVTQQNKGKSTLQLHVQEGVIILASPLNRYGYLISQQQSTQLGLAKYL